jgi:hypothetical protein
LAEPAGQRIGLARRASSQICQVVHVQVRGDFSQALAAGGEESAQEAALAEFLQARLPAFHTAAQPIQDSGQLIRDHGLRAFAVGMRRRIPLGRSASIGAGW